MEINAYRPVMTPFGTYTIKPKSEITKSDSIIPAETETTENEYRAQVLRSLGIGRVVDIVI